MLLWLLHGWATSTQRGELAAGNLHHVGRRYTPVEQAQPEAMPHDKPWSFAEAKWLYQKPAGGT